MSPQVRIVGAGLVLALVVIGAGLILRSTRPVISSPVTDEFRRAAAAPVESAVPLEAETVVTADGEAVFMQHCATCHMADGKGVPNFQPPIEGSPVVAEGATRLETVIRAGSAALRNRPNPMGWEMPQFGYLTDPEIKALVSYVRERFGPGE